MLTVTIDQSEGISGADMPEQAVKKMRIYRLRHPISPQPPAVFRISIYWTTFHHHLGAWSRLISELYQFESMPVLEEAVTSWFHCSAKNTRKREKIIARNKGTFFKACSRSPRSISWTSELTVPTKKHSPRFLNVKGSFLPHFGS